MAPEPPAGLSGKEWSEIQSALEASAYHAGPAIDPFFVQEAKLLAQSSPPIPDARFGYSVSVAGDTALVGAAEESTPPGRNVGAAYVFVRSGTAWSLQHRLTGLDTSLGDRFGSSVALFGDTAVVGAPLNDTIGPGAKGAAYVFVRSGAVWTEQQKLLASDGVGGDGFGKSVSVSGGTIVVGAPSKVTPGEGMAGAAYVFTRAGTVWTQQQKLTVSSGGSIDIQFGSSVSIDGETALIGGTANSLSPDTGAAWAFVRSGTVWAEQQKLTGSDAAPGGQFGKSVSLSGETALVGTGHATGPSAPTGRAYVFVRSGTTWTQQQKLTASDGAVNDDFGSSVSVSGNTVLVGAPGAAAAGVAVGAAYVFTRAGAIWTEQQKVLASDGAMFDSFGFSVALAGDTALLGATEHDIGSVRSVGAAYVFRGITPTVSDLAMSQSDSPDPVVGLQQVTYTVTVTNLGPEDAAFLSVTDTLPPTATFQSAIGSGWACAEAAGVVTCTRPALAVGPAPPIDVTVTAPPLGGSLTNLASVTHIGPDPVAGNNSASETTTVTQAPTADLSVAKSDGGAPVQWGQPFTWTITVANAGPDPATDASVTDVFPAGVTGMGWACVASGGSSCPASGSGEIAALVGLLAGGTATFTATGTVVVGTASLTNTATVEPPAAVYDPSAANNSGTVTSSAGPYGFYPLSPCRVVDTRTSGPALAANTTRTFDVVGLCEVPADAQAVAAILIAVNPEDLGDLRLYPTGLPAPEASTINFRTGRTRANNVALPLGAGGQINVQCDMPVGSTRSTHFVLDVVGYFK